MWPAGHIQREVAVAVVIAVEETPLLPAVQRVVGRVHIQDDLLRRRGVAVQEQLHQQGATIGGHAAAVKASAHLAAALIGQIDCDTVCAHGVCLWLVPNLLNTNRSSQIHTSCSRPW